MRIAVGASLALGLFILSSAARADLVVVEARGIGMAPGLNIDSTKPISLKAGQHLTLVSQSGATISLDGPFDGPPGNGQGGGAGVGTKLAEAVAGGTRLGEVGATRGVKPSNLPSPWVLDVSRSGVVCVAIDRPDVLWHPALAKDTDITITPADRSWRASATWPKGLEELPVSSGVALHPGVTYVVGFNGDQSAVTVDLLPATLVTDQMRAAFMADRGCEAQAEAMLRTIK